VSYTAFDPGRKISSPLTVSSGQKRPTRRSMPRQASSPKAIEHVRRSSSLLPSFMKGFRILTKLLPGPWMLSGRGTRALLRLVLQDRPPPFELSDAPRVGLNTVGAQRFEHAVSQRRRAQAEARRARGRGAPGTCGKCAGGRAGPAAARRRGAGRAARRVARCSADFVPSSRGARSARAPKSARPVDTSSPEVSRDCRLHRRAGGRVPFRRLETVEPDPRRGGGELLGVRDEEPAIPRPPNSSSSSG